MIGDETIVLSQPQTALLTFLWVPEHDQMRAHAVSCLEFRPTTVGDDQDGNGVRTTRVWRRVLGVEHAVIESVDLEQGERGGEVLVARVRVKAGAARRCSRCQRRCPGYDTSASPRRWRSLDLGSTQVFLQATTSRVSCPEHGVVVAAVPWARPGSRFTTAFEDTAAWLVCHAALSVVAILLRVAWRSVSDIITRVVAARAGQLDRLAGLRRIGIDEISYRYVGDPCQGVSRGFLMNFCRVADAQGGPAL